MSPPPEAALRQLAAIRRFTLVRAASLGLKVAALVALLALVSKLAGGP